MRFDVFGWLGISVGLVCCAGGELGQGASTAPNQHPMVGLHAPSFARPGVVNASSVSMEHAKGKVIVIDFWATYCEPCKKEFPQLQALSDRYRGDVVVYGLSEDDTQEGISGFVKKTGVRFPIGWDEGNAIGQRYKLEKMPTSYVVDKKGIIRFVHGGYGEGVQEQIAREIEQLLH
jgi:thiol-disulfide isomerase/thioredoxin